VVDEFEIAETAIIADDLNLERSVSLVSRYIKPLGPRYYGMFLEPIAAYNALRALWRKDLAGEGFGILLDQKSLWFLSKVSTEAAETDDILKSGVLSITELGMEHTTDEVAYVAKIIEKVSETFSGVTEKISDEQF
jgi:hypothetical protein